MNCLSENFFTLKYKVVDIFLILFFNSVLVDIGCVHGCFLCHVHFTSSCVVIDPWGMLGFQWLKWLPYTYMLTGFS